ncbi:UNVERIFIED_CONTAM: hypothetical protein DV101_05365 [Bifidobacterium animalis]|uniref:Uncharacterized protein n=2 Tax=Bifidobacterium TaxID=1678 RepID=A0A7J5TLH5_BIFBI|nr:hypothetical protein BALAC2494_01805 [Bifidobacterium animalis subsp. lactis CNCM I-2494]AXM93189.1 hypothetical protein CJD49_02350 [Bifidobacterium animalis subsp. lactis]KAB5633086.1 hypothetical protein GBA51_04545 [Bifidobacterium animalis]KAB7478031.1 hypothetical protein GBA86_10135 [Bifidobacterium bifidum]AXQ17420.1 hypothetical protein D0Y52_00630 [Bifidobacterium animalis subsp. lactis]
MRRRGETAQCSTRHCTCADLQVPRRRGLATAGKQVFDCGAVICGVGKYEFEHVFELHACSFPQMWKTLWITWV